MKILGVNPGIRGDIACTRPHQNPRECHPRGLQRAVLRNEKGRPSTPLGAAARHHRPENS
jgi:hypothetical protein